MREDRTKMGKDQTRMREDRTKMGKDQTRMVEDQTGMRERELNWNKRDLLLIMNKFDECYIEYSSHWRSDRSLFRFLQGSPKIVAGYKQGSK